MKKFHLDVITPEKTVFDGDIVSLVVPAEGGSLGVLANHAPLITPVEIGDAKAVDADGKEVWFLLTDGFLEVESNHARLLVAVAERGEDIDEARAHEAESRARERLKKRSQTDFDLARAEAALRKAMIRQKIKRGLKSSGVFDPKPRA